MARESETFRWISEALGEASQLTPLEARGTVRLALRKSGLEVHSVGPSDMILVIKEILPGMLRSRGIDGFEDVCQKLVEGLESQELRVGPDHQASPDSVFARIFGQA